ncbi:hypothetical protein RS84_00037 [Microbacterium hydrocarbonoxydans]|uniref:Uncharacterized protein n=1 Tax=Microbacterium hydrocarbonoxydans TaxID=273678 RepID=A0A0M2HYP1_9MICO|nr:hypothetical protein [Microbacterium hydrocarbonoxydans]KJL49563.1 hypothetical protein RS84_00037 [Microbacterium hydrocarbonoxydans]
MSKAATAPAPRARLRWTPTATLYAVLAALVVIVVSASLTGNPFGAYFAAYVSTALVIYGLLDLTRKIRARRSVARTLPVLATGLVTGLFMNMGMVLGWSVYLAFLVGQLFTVGLVVWLMSSDKPKA